MTVRQLTHELKRCGCRPLRTRGSHQTWELPNGGRETLVVNHPGAAAHPGLLSRLRKQGILSEDSKH